MTLKPSNCWQFSTQILPTWQELGQEIENVNDTGEYKCKDGIMHTPFVNNWIQQFEMQITSSFLHDLKEKKNLPLIQIITFKLIVVHFIKPE